MIPFTCTQLAEIQLATLFTSSPEGKLRYVREPGYDEMDPAPRFFMSRTPEKNIWRFRHDLPHDIVQSLHQICLEEPIPNNLATPPLQSARIQQLLNGHAPVTDEWRGPAYWIPEGSGLPESTILITEETADLLKPHFPWKISSPSNFRTSPLIATVVNHEAVSICYCARITETAAEAGVETADHFRGLGYAGLAVARWAETIRQSGRIPLYSTSWQNIASQKVARKLQLVNYADNWSMA